MNKKLSGFLAYTHKAEILTIFCLYFGRNDDINSFWNLLTFSAAALSRIPHKFWLESNEKYLKEKESNLLLIYFEWKMKLYDFSEHLKLSLTTWFSQFNFSFSSLAQWLFLFILSKKADLTFLGAEICSVLKISNFAGWKIFLM